MVRNLSTVHSLRWYEQRLLNYNQDFSASYDLALLLLPPPPLPSVSSTGDKLLTGERGRGGRGAKSSITHSKHSRMKFLHGFKYWEALTMWIWVSITSYRLNPCKISWFLLFTFITKRFLISFFSEGRVMQGHPKVDTRYRASTRAKPGVNTAYSKRVPGSVLYNHVFA
jgi:hypothetical protein